MSRVDLLKVVEKKEQVGDMCQSGRARDICSRDEGYGERHPGKVGR